jgi:hypothetical protein
VISRQAPRTRAANRLVESGRALNRTSGSSTAAVRPTPSGQGPGAALGSPSSAATSAASRQARTGMRAPTSDDRHLGHGERGSQESHRQGDQERRQGQPDLEGRPREDSGGVWKLHRASLVRPWPVTRLRATMT